MFSLLKDCFAAHFLSSIADSTVSTEREDVRIFAKNVRFMVGDTHQNNYCTMIIGDAAVLHEKIEPKLSIITAIHLRINNRTNDDGANF